MDDKVSIIVPCWNLLYQTKDCISALALNVDYPFELIIINNASTDETEQWLNRNLNYILAVGVPDISFLKNPHFKNFKIINNEYPTSLSEYINLGVCESTGKYISIVANDIVIPQNMYKFLIEQLDKDSTIGAIGPWFTEDLNALKMNPERLDSILYYLELVNNKSDKIDNNWHFSVCHIMRRDAWNKIGPWDENFKTHCNDNDWGIRLELCEYKAVTYHKFICYHHLGSLARKQIPKENKVAEIDLAYFIGKWGKRPDDKQPVSVIKKEIRDIAKLGNYVNN